MIGETWVEVKVGCGDGRIGIVAVRCAFGRGGEDDPARFARGKWKLKGGAFGGAVIGEYLHPKIESLRGRAVGDDELEFAVAIGAAVGVVGVVVHKIRWFARRRRSGKDFYFFVGGGRAVGILQVEKEDAFGMGFDGAVFFEEIHGRLRCEDSCLC